jgi:hypothetical protein
LPLEAKGGQTFGVGRGKDAGKFQIQLRVEILRFVFDKKIVCFCKYRTWDTPTRANASRPTNLAHNNNAKARYLHERTTKSKAGRQKKRRKKKRKKKITSASAGATPGCGSASVAAAVAVVWMWNHTPLK